MSDQETQWPSSWVRAVLGTAVLAVLEAEELHGYAIAEHLDRRGLGRPKGGSLYPLLGSLEDLGAVETSWVQGERGPGRRVYRLTAAGRARLVEERADWAQLVAELHRTPDTPEQEARR